MERWQSGNAAGLNPAVWVMSPAGVRFLLSPPTYKENGDREANCPRLESGWPARARRFESCPFRHTQGDYMKNKNDIWWGERFDQSIASYSLPMAYPKDKVRDAKIKEVVVSRMHFDKLPHAKRVKK